MVIMATVPTKSLFLGFFFRAVSLNYLNILLWSRVVDDVSLPFSNTLQEHHKFHMYTDIQINYTATFTNPACLIFKSEM